MTSRRDIEVAEQRLRDAEAEHAETVEDLLDLPQMLAADATRVPEALADAHARGVDTRLTPITHEPLDPAVEQRIAEVNVEVAARAVAARRHDLDGLTPPSAEEE